MPFPYVFEFDFDPWGQYFELITYTEQYFELITYTSEVEQ